MFQFPLDFETHFRPSYFMNWIVFLHFQVYFVLIQNTFNGLNLLFENYPDDFPFDKIPNFYTNYFILLLTSEALSKNSSTHQNTQQQSNGQV